MAEHPIPSRWKHGFQAALWCTTLVTGQVFAQVTASDPPPAAPPAWSVEQLIPVFLPGPGELTHGVDASTLAIGEDQVVRYVFVSRSSTGAVNASYEGLSCKSAQMRVWARWNTPTQQWRMVENSSWKSLKDDRGTRHAAALARNGMCDGPTPNAPLSRMERELRTGRGHFTDG